MHSFVKEALGDYPTGTLDLGASERYFKSYMHEPHDPIIVGAGAGAGAAAAVQAGGDAEAGVGNADDNGGVGSDDGSVLSALDMTVDKVCRG